VTLPLTMPGIIRRDPRLHSLPRHVPDADLLGAANLMDDRQRHRGQFKAANDWPFGAALSFLLMYATIRALAIRGPSARRSKGVDI
jgi:spermidine/putrescine transport system permease protein